MGQRKKIWLQHATPQQLIDLKLITREQWKSYYKFIIYRNSWSRAYSDYLWMMKTRGIADSFPTYLNKTGAFKGTLTNKNVAHYAGDHLNLQKDYFFLNGKRIEYDQEVNFQDIEKGLCEVIKDLKLPSDFFKTKLNESIVKKSHYSFFYNKKKKLLVAHKYKEDIDFFKFKYEEKKNIFQKLIMKLRFKEVCCQLLNTKWYLIKNRLRVYLKKQFF